MKGPEHRRPVILFATPVLHHPPVGGPTLRIENSIKALSRCAEVHVCSRIPVSSIGGPPAAEFYNTLCSGFHVVRFIGPSRWLRFLAWIGNAVCWRTLGTLPFGKSLQPTEDFESIVTLANRVKADVVWLGYGNVSYPLAHYLKEHSSLPVVVDTDSVWSRFILRELPYASNPEDRSRIQEAGDRKQDEERCGTAAADITTAVSEVDAEYYRQLVASRDQVQLFPNAIDVDCYRDVPSPPADLKTPCVVLAGSFGFNSPMHDAVRWLLAQVWPHVKDVIPSVHLYIIGSGSDRVLGDIDDASVTVTGRVLSVLPYLGHASVALVPLRFESGTRFKILEAGACGVPVVSTSLGAEGLAVTNGHDIVIADEPDAFANSIVNLILDRQEALRVAGNLRALVQREYGMEALVTAAGRVLSQLRLRLPVTGL